MATFGSFPGVEIETAGGTVTGVAVGREQNTIIVGEGDPGASGTADANTATTISSQSDADTQFGSGTELADAMKDALSNGANIDFLYGIMPTETSVTGESVTQSDTLDNAPIIEDTSLITIADSGGTDPSVEFRYASPPSTPGSSDTAFINPSSGEIEFDAAAGGSYTIDYDYMDWSTAFTEATDTIAVEETGVIIALDEAESVANTLQSDISTARGNYKLALGLVGAEHNANTSDDDAKIDTSTYSHSLDDDAMFLAGPVRLVDTDHTVLGGIGGLMGGASLTDPIHNDTLSGFSSDLEQQITKTEADDIRGEDAIPIRQTDTNGPITVADNISTSSATDWSRDLYTRRIVDDVILIAKTLGDTIIGKINSEDNREATEDAIEGELRDLVRRNLIKDNTGDTTNYFVSVTQDSSNDNEVNIDIGVTPTGVVKRADVQLTINTS